MIGITPFHFLISASSQKTLKAVAENGYTLLAEDKDKILLFYADNVKLTVPAGLPEGIRFECKQLGNGSISIQPEVDSDVQLFSATGLIGTDFQYCTFSIDNIFGNNFHFNILNGGRPVDIYQVLIVPDANTDTITSSKLIDAQVKAIAFNNQMITLLTDIPGYAFDSETGRISSNMADFFTQNTIYIVFYTK